MMMSKEKILKRLKEHLEEAKKKGYKEENIVGIFLYGSQNYGFANEDSDIDSKLIILPTFEDFCLNPNHLISKEIILDNNEHIDVKDIRIFRENLLKQNINYIETLFTEYYILNPTYADLFNKFFIKNREQIARVNASRAVSSIVGQLLHTIEQNPTDNKKLYNGKRLLYFLERYIEGRPYLECIKPQGESYDFLWNLKFKITELSRDDNFKQELYATIKQEAKTLEKIVKDAPFPLAPCEELNKGVCEILRFSFGLTKPEQSLLTKKDFFNKLTHAEERAYYSIVKEIGAEGNVTISKLTETNHISRAVYNNLLAKMKEMRVAEISSMGMKGTGIKITHNELKAEIVDF